MEPKAVSPLPTRPAPEDRQGGMSTVIIPLLVGLFLLLCIFASDQAIIYSFDNSSGPGPWWVQLAFPALFVSWIAWLISMVWAYSAYKSSKRGSDGPIALLSTLNMLLAILLICMCFYTLGNVVLGGA